MGTLTRCALYVWPGLPGWEWQSGDLVTGEVSQIDYYMIHIGKLFNLGLDLPHPLL